ncbi:MAG TPA: SpoIVB peptidase S55 domain-containing protein [Thermoanaerobaculia bacterium]|nr:SpoIVB peptidase S55 domain-containing protein [Thermoanaerobaculia bacterium]
MIRSSRLRRQALAGLLLLAIPASLATAADQAPPIQVPQPTAPVEHQGLGPKELPTISIDEVKAGQKGYGLSVFSGTEPERFEVEVVGILRNQNAVDMSYILARLTGKGLEKSGVASGMSGSPVFLDGRLAGAVAFSWPFSHEAIAGITPIESMRQLSGLKGVEPVTPIPPVPMVSLPDLLAGRIPPDLLQRELSKLRPHMANDAVPSVQWTTSGFGEQSLGILRQALGSVGTAGKARPGDTDPDLKLGSSVGIVLVDGDFRLAAIGTVTDRYGDQVLAFGHPFLGLGPINVPMSSAEVVMVLSNQNSSFKISNLGDEIGAFTQDRKAGIQGRLGAKAPTVPMVLRLSGGGSDKPREFKMRLADVPLYTPMLVSSSLVAGLESASYTSGSQGLDVTAHFKLKKYGDLEVRQSFDGDSATGEAAAFLMAVASYVSQSAIEKVGFEDIEVEVSQSLQPRAATIVGAHAERTVVRPGEKVGINLDLAAYRGERFRRSVSIDLPEDLPAGRYSLLIGDGASADGARLTLEPADPVNFPQLLELLKSLHSRRDLVVLGVYGGPGLSVAGEVMPRLPGSVRSIWGAASSDSAVPLRATIAQEYDETMPMPISGLVRVDLEVRRRDPVPGGGETPETPKEEPGETVSVSSTAGGDR